MDDTNSPRSTIKACWNTNIFGLVWTHCRAQIDLFLVQKCPFRTYLTQDVENLWKNNQKRMILGLLGQLFKLIWIQIFLKGFGPILGFKLAYLWSKNAILGHICPKKWKISGKNNQKWMVLIFLCQLFKLVGIQIFSDWFGPI